MQKLRPTKKSDIQRSWHLYDIGGKILGRAATEIANLIRGKAKPYYVAHLDCGDYVVVINTKDVKVTGKKEKNKVYSRYSGYPGGLKRERYQDLIKDHPEKIVYKAVFGMLPDNKLRMLLLKRLYLYSGSNHPYKNMFNKEN